MLCFANSGFAQKAAIHEHRNFGIIRNEGQVIDQAGNQNEDVLYIAQISADMNIQFRKDGFSYDVFYKKTDSPSPSSYFFHRVDVAFIGAEEGLEILVKNPTDDKVNYTNLKSSTNQSLSVFRQIEYKNVYPNIDLVFEVDPNRSNSMKYNFILHAGAELTDISLLYSGFLDGFKDVSGKIVFELAKGDLREVIPLSWTEPNQKPIEVEYSWENISPNSGILRYSCDDCPKIQEDELIIDPVPELSWSTYVGDTLLDAVGGVVTDRYGYVYITGRTQSLAFMATSGVYQDTLFGGNNDAFVAKFHRFGFRIWSSYFGGEGDDRGIEIAVDTILRCTIYGSTDSHFGIAQDTSYQSQLGGEQDAFLAQFDEYGQLRWSTYVGSSTSDYPTDIDVDFDRNIFITGYSADTTGAFASSNAIQSTNAGLNDAFICKFSELGDRIWSTYYGGIGDDVGLCVSVEETNLVVGGSTINSDSLSSIGAFQEISNGGYDGFILKTDTAGIYQWSSYFGGPADDFVQGLKIFNENIFSVGSTNSDTLISSNNAWKIFKSDTTDAFLSKFNLIGERQWSTYVGANGIDEGLEVTTELNGSVFIAGITNSEDSLATPLVQDTMFSGLTDVFFAKYLTDGFQEWCSYYGGESKDILHGLDVYGNTSIYLSGSTQSETQISHGDVVFQEVYANGGEDGFLAKYIQESSTSCNGLSCNGQMGAHIVACSNGPVSITIEGGELGSGAEWVWYTGACGEFGQYLFTGDTLVYFFTEPTTLYVRPESVINAGDCFIAEITINPAPIAEIFVPETACEGEDVFIETGGGTSYSWTGPNGFISYLQYDTLLQVTAAFEGLYEVIVRDEYLCADTASSYLMVLDAPDLVLESTSTGCFDSSDGQVSVSASGVGPFDISWYPSGSSDSLLTDLSTGWYWVEVTDVQDCMTTDSIQVNQAPSMITGTTIAPAGCPNGFGSAEIELQGNEDQYEIVWSYDLSTETSLMDVPQGVYLVTVQSVTGCFESVELSIPNVSGLAIQVDSIFHETCVGFNDGFAMVSAVGGSPQFDFLWSPGNFETDSVGQLSPGTYVVSISDSLLCMVSDTVVINQAIPIEIEMASTPALCDLPVGTIDVTVFGGVNPYIIDWREDLISEFFVDSLIGLEYGFTVYDSLGCSLDTTIVVESMNNLALELSAEVLQTFPGEEFTLFADLQNGAEDMQFDWSIGAEIFCTNCYEVQTSILESSWFILEVVDANGCYALDSIFIEVIPCTNAFAPTIFSPNADALNDSWCVLGSCFKSFEAKLYDQWGELIFETDDKSTCWDGSYKGKPVQSGVYVFRYVGTTFEGELISEHGTLRVIR